MIDLKKLAETHRYRITLDPAAEHEPRAERPWLYRVPCEHGFISVHSATELAGFADGAFWVKKLLAIPGVRPYQVGDREARVIFPPEMLAQVAGVLGARRRRQLSPEDRARRAERARSLASRRVAGR